MQDKIKVVVADDMKAIADNMQSIIAANDRVVKVWTAYDGEDEIIQIMNLKPDLVFTDMQMPKRTGIDVIEAIQCYPSVTKKPKFILVTGDRDASLLVKARELGFEIEYKPICAQRINEIINNFEPIEIDKEEEERKRKLEQEELEAAKRELRKVSLLRRLFKDK